MATIRVNANGLASGTARNDTLLGNSLENIMFGNRGNDILKGGGSTDLLSGDWGNDTIYGGAGNDFMGGGRGFDTLVGGSGKDAFVFDEKPSLTNIDTITDYNAKFDSIVLDHSIFAKAGKINPNLVFTPLKRAAFWTGDAAHDANDRILYNKDTGALSYDPDGTGAKAAVQFAVLKPGLAMTYKEFFLV